MTITRTVQITTTVTSLDGGKVTIFDDGTSGTLSIEVIEGLYSPDTQRAKVLLNQGDARDLLNAISRYLGETER